MDGAAIVGVGALFAPVAVVKFQVKSEANAFPAASFNRRPSRPHPRRVHRPRQQIRTRVERAAAPWRGTTPSQPPTTTHLLHQRDRRARDRHGIHRLRERRRRRNRHRNPRRPRSRRLSDHRRRRRVTTRRTFESHPRPVAMVVINAVPSTRHAQTHLRPARHNHINQLRRRRSGHRAAVEQLHRPLEHLEDNAPVRTHLIVHAHRRPQPRTIRRNRNHDIRQRVHTQPLRERHPSQRQRPPIPRPQLPIRQIHAPPAPTHSTPKPTANHSHNASPLRRHSRW